MPFNFNFFAFELNSLPKPKPIGSCICRRPYNPDNSSEESIMHFCPRPNCRKLYHRNCLPKSTFINTSDSVLLPYHLLLPQIQINPLNFPLLKPTHLIPNHHSKNIKQANLLNPDSGLRQIYLASPPVIGGPARLWAIEPAAILE